MFWDVPAFCAAFCQLFGIKSFLAYPYHNPVKWKGKKTCIHHKLIAYSEFRVEEKVEDYFPRELQKRLIGGSIF